MARLKKFSIFAIKFILLLSAFAIFALPFLTPRGEIKSKLEIKEICGTPGKTKILTISLYYLTRASYVPLSMSIKGH